ncbi:hypothetical protein ACM66B_007047 [Microbotryomycetes sp. NB124-2]
MTTGASERSAQLNRFLDVVLATWTEPSTDTARQCGEAIAVSFKLIRQLGITARAALVAQELIELADDRINAYDYKSVPECWRMLYTDASLLSAVIQVLQLDKTRPERRLNEQMVSSIVSQLDLAIVIAGAPGPDRYDMVQLTIKLVQRLIPLTAETASRPRKRIKLATDSRQRATTPAVSQPINVLDDFPELDAYLTRHCQVPFIVRQAVRHWPALTRWSDRSHLETVAGPARVVPVELGGDYTSSDWGQQILPFSTVLDAFFNHDDETRQTKLYLAQHDLFKQFPELEDDIVVPDIVYSCPPRPKDVLSFEPVSNERGYFLNAWFGPSETLSPAHTDPYYNCYAQAVGSKWVWVAPPQSDVYMNAFRSSDDPDVSNNGAPDSTIANEKDPSQNSSTTSHLLTNTSRIDVTLSEDQMTSEEYCEFKRNVVPMARQAVLEAGDVLVMPPGWWHSFKSLEPSFSVSIWY